MIEYKTDFSRICNNIPIWEWYELSVGIEKSLISLEDVILYATLILSEDLAQFDLVLELSIATEEEAREILHELIEVIGKNDIQQAYNKWIFAIIYDAILNSKDNIYDIIEDIYVEFDYPEIISNLIRYMPCDDNRSLEEKLTEYVSANKEIWC